MSRNQEVAITIPDTDEIELTNRSGPASSQGGDHVMPQTSMDDAPEIEVGVKMQSPGAGQGAESRQQDGDAIVQIANAIRGRLDNVGPNFPPEISPSIFRIHSQIREEDPKSYEPQLISIGPFHHGKPALEPMERLKLKYLQDLLTVRMITLDDCVKAVIAVEDDARSYYSEDVGLDRTKFVDVLVVDGCFILEFLIRRALGPVGPPFNYAKWNMTFLRNDLLLLENQIPFFVLQKLFDLVPDGTVSIRRNTCNLMDLALHYISRGTVVSLDAEPQVFHLLHLFHLCILQNSDTSQLPAREFSPVTGRTGENPLPPSREFSPVSEQTEKNPLCPKLEKPLHQIFCSPCRRVLSKLITYFYIVLLLVWHCFRRPRRTAAITDNYPRTIPSASELRKAGVGFVMKVVPKKGKDGFVKKVDQGEGNDGDGDRREGNDGVSKKGNKDGQYCLDVSFKDGNIEMSTLIVDQKVKSEFRNLIALEECSKLVKSRVIPFSMFMDNLIDTAEDVAILEEHGVLVSKLGSKEEVASFFNKLCSGSHTNFDEHYLKDLFKDVTEYCEMDQNRWMAQLENEHFSNPWTFCAALVFLVLTIIQATFAVLSYVKQ